MKKYGTLIFGIVGVGDRFDYLFSDFLDGHHGF